MAKISNTTAYPYIAPETSDWFVITDTSDGNATKSCLVSALINMIPATLIYPLQEVLDSGATASGDITKPAGEWDGVMSLSQSGTFGGVQRARKFEFNADGTAGALGNGAVSIFGNVEIETNTTDNSGSEGSLKIAKTLTTGGAASFLSTSSFTGDATFDSDIILNNTGGIITNVSGILDIDSVGGMRLRTNGSSTPSLTLNAGGNFSLLASGASINDISGGTGDINIGSFSQGDIDIKSSSLIDLRSSAGVNIFATGTSAGNVDIAAFNGTVRINAQDTAGNGEIFIQSNIGGDLSTLELHGDGQGAGVGFELASVNHGGKISGFGDIQINSNGSSITLTTNNDNTGSISINAGDDAKLLAQQPAVMVKVSKGSAGTITEGTPVYIVSDLNGHLTVEAADAATPATMPAIGIATSDITSSGGGVNPTGTMVMVGVYEFSAGTIVTGASNDALYVASGGGLTTTRPTAAGATVQVVGRIIDPSSPDKIYVNAVGYSPDELDIDWVQNAAYVGDANGNAVATTGILEVDVPNLTTALREKYSVNALFALGNNQIQLGLDALGSSTAGTRNMAIGQEAMGASNNTLDNIAIGYQALAAITGNINNQNVVVGNLSTDVMTAGENNVIIGHASLGNQVDGSDRNVAIGASALGNVNRVGGIDNAVAIGFEAGWDATLGPTVAIGSLAGRSNAGGKNTYVGTEAGKLNTANGNTFVGTLTGQASTTAGGLTIVGSSAGLNLLTGAENTFVGSTAAQNVDVGGSNTVVGANSAPTLVSGELNTIVGHSADVFDPADANVVLVGDNTIGPAESTVIGSGANANNAGQVILGQGATGAGKAQAMIAFSNAVGTAYGVIGPGGGGPASPEMQFPNNAAAAAGGIPIGGLYTVGPLGGPASDPAILAIRTA